MEIRRKRKLDARCTIPNDIIFDVLLKLPVKSLLRFKSVCRRWFNEISSPYFANSHLNQGRRSRQLLVIPISERSPSAQTISFYRYSEAENVATLMLEKELPGDEIVHLLVTYCDGLVLTFSRTNIFLCNPSTGELLTLPKGNPSKPLCEWSSDLVGFGLDPSTKRYKVVRMFYRWFDFKTRDYSIGCEVFEVGSQSWRSTEDPPFPVNEQYPVVLNNVLHWISEMDLCSEQAILTFHLHGEKFGVIRPPPVNFGSISVMYLMTDGHKLFFVEGNWKLNLTCIWMLKDEASHTWVRMYSFRKEDSKPYIPLEIHGGEIFLSTTKRLDCYDTRTDKTRTLLAIPKEVDNGSPSSKAYMGLLNGASSFRFTLYAESLVPLKDI
ncbi:F-box protein At5g10340-like [Typha latifolia]|uniref:F-box protein At5g10340-like n=1 Tax=Typha latifolia TaxID=4733 RepID=UPI003C2ADD79